MFGCFLKKHGIRTGIYDFLSRIGYTLSTMFWKSHMDPLISLFTIVTISILLSRIAM